MAPQVVTAASPHDAADRAVHKHAIQVSLPWGGTFTLPSTDLLAFCAGTGLLAALGVVEWPVAAVLIVGHGLVESRHGRMLQEFGQALEQA